MKLVAICRLCKKASYETPNQGMARYSIRHWCHWECGIERWGFVEFMGKLSASQIACVPMNVIEGHPNGKAFMEAWAKS
jgi:hypothetical protein